ncbi:hypothetical protein HaLaN_32003 [Haematococcus lacustris]|uniref:Uncharacterized protein n=1 Tax=Haematococcus lacustris TaxID=44745 RepID=A0A6A0AJS2_HAELA|nr:hypothetical protein HaLaN_32003 [Haematococcus lacustris]
MQGLSSRSEVMKGWLKPKLKGLVMAHIRNTLTGLHGDEQEQLVAGAGAALELPTPPAAPPWQQLAAGAGAALGLPTPPAAPPRQLLAAGAGASPELLTPPAEEQGDTAQLDTSSAHKRRAGVRDWTQPAEQGSIAIA